MASSIVQLARSPAGLEMALALFGRFAIQSTDLLAEDCRIVPRKAQLGIACETPQRLHQGGCAFVVVEKYVPLCIFDESDDIDSAFHRGVPARDGRLRPAHRFLYR